MSEIVAQKMDVPTRTVGSFLEVLAAALRLGLTSFGGPIAQLGYFRDEYVVQRKWLDEKSYADLVALCQFLPGPASSQVGMAIGIARAGCRSYRLMDRRLFTTGGSSLCSGM